MHTYRYIYLHTHTYMYTYFTGSLASKNFPFYLQNITCIWYRYGIDYDVLRLASTSLQLL